MATNFPASLDTLTNPTSSDSLSSPSHSAQHANVNDAVEALQAKVGADSSAVATSLDYKVAQLEAISHGKILQVVSTTKTTTFTTASATKSAVTGFDVTITPSAASNKVLILVTGLVGHDTTGRVVDMDLERNGTPISQSGTSDTYGPIADGLSAGLVISYLDSPATTSAVTYRLTMANGGAGNAYLNRYGSGTAIASTSTITAFEVSA